MFRSLKKGMKRTRQRFSERMNVLFDRGPDVDEEFWDGLEEALIESDVGAVTADTIVENMRDQATRQAMSDGYEVMDALVDQIADQFTQTETNIFDENPVTVIFVGVNGAGKTTTCGKIAAAEKAAGRKVIMGNGDTFRAAAREQLDIWAQRSGVEVVERDRGADPASVCYDTLERAEKVGADMVLIDTAGRLHTSSDLMRELQKVVNVVRKRSTFPVKVVLVLDATTGQNGITQATEFNKALQLDGLIVTKLDGTARGGIALNVSHELNLPIAKVGVGEQLDDLQDFDPQEYAAALIGAEPEDEQDTSQEPEPAKQAEEMAQRGAKSFESQPVADNASHPEGEQTTESGAQEPEATESVAVQEHVSEPIAAQEPVSIPPAAEVAQQEEESAEQETQSNEFVEETASVEEPVKENAEAASGAETAAVSNEEEETEETSSEGAETEGESDKSGKKKGRFKRLFKWHGRKDR